MQLTYLACDGTRRRRTFKTIESARRFARKWLGANPEQGSGYAVSQDGIGTLCWEGTTAAELFPKPEDVEREDLRTWDEQMRDDEFEASGATPDSGLDLPKCPHCGRPQLWAASGPYCVRGCVVDEPPGCFEVSPF